MAFDLGLLFEVGPELMPLTPRIENAVATLKKLMADPQVKQTIANGQQVLAEVAKIMADPAVKDAIETFSQVSAILSKAQANG